jgi:hypothetical protein
VGVILGDTATVSEVHLYPRDDSGNEGRGFPIGFEVQVSLDGKEWKTVGSRSGLPQSKDEQLVKLQPQKARYVRVRGTKLRRNPDDGLYSMQIVELEVY